MSSLVFLSRVTRGVPLLAILLCSTVGGTAAVAAQPPLSVSQAWNQGALVGFLLLPLLTGLGALEGQLSRRRGWRDIVDASERGPLGWALLSLGPLWLAAAVALTVSSVLSMVAYGASPLGYIQDLLFPLYAILLLMTGATTGYTIGRRSSSVVLAPITAVLTLAVGYGGTFFRNTEDRAWIRWLEVYPLDFTYTETTSANPALWLLKSAMLALVLSSSMLLFAARPRLALFALTLSGIMLFSVILGSPFIEYAADVSYPGPLGQSLGNESSAPTK